MAEFCKECFCEKIDPFVDEDKVVVSDYLDLCEGCGEMKKVVVCVARGDAGDGGKES